MRRQEIWNKVEPVLFWCLLAGIVGGLIWAFNYL